MPTNFLVGHGDHVRQRRPALGEFNVAGARIQFPGSWMPIRGFSQSTAHILVLGAKSMIVICRLPIRVII